MDPGAGVDPRGNARPARARRQHHEKHPRAPPGLPPGAPHQELDQTCSVSGRRWAGPARRRSLRAPGSPTSACTRAGRPHRVRASELDGPRADASAEIIRHLFPHLRGRHRGERIKDFRRAWQGACRRAKVGPMQAGEIEPLGKSRTCRGVFRWVLGRRGVIWGLQGAVAGIVLGIPPESRSRPD
jgi:hypothetical protein